MEVKVEFFHQKKLKKILPKKAVTVAEAQTLISQADKYAEECQIKEEITLTILQGDEVIFTDYYLFGVGKCRNLILMVDQTLQTIFKDQPDNEKKNLLDLLSRELNGVDTVEEVLPIPTKQTSEKIEKKKSRTKTYLWISSIFFTVVIISLLCSFYFSSAQNTVSQPKEQKQESIEQLLQQKDYDKAMKNYPKESSKVISFLVQEKDFQTLEEINKKFPTHQGDFELACYRKNWKKVVDFKLDQLSKEQRVMVAYAYVQLNEFDKAETLNEALKSERIQQEILEGRKKFALQKIKEKDLKTAENIQSKINDPELEDWITLGKAYIDLIQQYEKQGDSDKAKTWDKLLQNLEKEVK